MHVKKFGVFSRGSKEDKSILLFCKGDETIYFHPVWRIDAESLMYFL